MIRIIIPLFLMTLLACTESTKNETIEKVENFAPQRLPEDISQITKSDLKELILMFGDAKVIGISEGTHGMIEPLNFRNELLKLLVEEKRIGAIAFESGLVEGKLIYDYVNGKKVSLDTVMLKGVTCGFGEFEVNRELLIWLREYNLTLAEHEKIHMYGYDIPGCASNPFLENARVGFDYALDYLDKMDSINSEVQRSLLSPLVAKLRVSDNQEDNRPSYLDIDSTGWNSILGVLLDLAQIIETNEKEYVAISGLEEYLWAQRSVFCAEQNVKFLQGLGNADSNFSPREKGQLENVRWIVEREKGRNVALFAHLAHLAKELHSKTTNSLPELMAGEYLAAEYGEDYCVIGNFYRKLDWFDDDPIILKDSLLSNELEKEGMSNFYMKLDKTDPIWQKEWAFAKLTSYGQLYMYPAKSVDIVFYNDIQTWLYLPQEEEAD
jgi:erythromycin esterase-like protein